MVDTLWQDCLCRLQNEIPEQQYNTWIKPLQIQTGESSNELQLLAPNRFIKNWVETRFSGRLKALAEELSEGKINSLRFDFLESSQGLYHQQDTVVSANDASRSPSYIKSQAEPSTINVQPAINQSAVSGALSVSAIRPSDSLTNSTVEPNVDAYIDESDIEPSVVPGGASINGKINNRARSVGLMPHYTFDSFVEGKSNQLARAAAQQVAENPGGAYNPLFLYGGVGLGKTHLMHAIGNALRQRNPDARVVYLHSERFVADMVKALQLNAIGDFKRHYRSLDALLIDDIQFFANKERSQEELFHTFNALLEGGHQIILTSDKYPKEIKGLEERLRSRFGWGLTVEVAPPELETRVAILLKKAQEANMLMSHDVAFFVAQRIRANVRDLEGALKRINAHALLTGQMITIELVQEALRDLFSLQERLVNISNIQKTVAEYFKIKLADLLSSRRSRSIARPRQIAMALAKELTSRSLPEIGDSFGGRDHTTVLHACRKIKELRESNPDVEEDYKNLQRLLTT